MRGMYTPLRPAHTTTLTVRGMPYGVSQWGPAHSALPPLVLLHGWMDVGASFQWVVDAFSDDWLQGRRVLAPDWRGFGRSQPSVPCEHYVWADYLADLDALLDQWCPPHTPVDVVGHSMGGHIAMVYAGVRPARVRRLVNLEGFGLPATTPAQAPQRLGQWLDQLQAQRQGHSALRSYDSREAVAARLRNNNPRLPLHHALWLAEQWAAPDAQGRWHLRADAAHKVVNPQLFRWDEVQAIYAAITAPVLALQASDDSLGTWFGERYTLADYHARLQCVPNCRTGMMADAGHMLHHDQPAAVAQAIEAFLDAPLPFSGGSPYPKQSSMS